MLIEIPLDAIKMIFRQAALGRLMGGIVHNLNGHLQNLGMDMEMAGYSLRREEGLPPAFSKAIGERLARMTEEFDKIGQMIRLLGTRAASVDGNFTECEDLSGFLRQELSFLRSNLYLKHRVRQELMMEEPLPSLNRLPAGVPVYLGWFLQAFAEELEKRLLDNMTIKVTPLDGVLEVGVVTAGSGISSDFERMTGLELSALGPLQGINDIGVTLSVILLKSSGVSVTTRNEASGAAITFTIPVTP